LKFEASPPVALERFKEVNWPLAATTQERGSQQINSPGTIPHKNNLNVRTMRRTATCRCGCTASCGIIAFFGKATKSEVLFKKQPRATWD